MAVERVKEFTINLGEIIKARLENFASSRAKIRAREESDFQTRIVDEDLSLDEQLAYRQAQLEKEKGAVYPDQDFIKEIESSIALTKRLVRQKKFRDKYFDLQEELASGKKGLEDMLVFLENELQGGGYGSEMKETIQSAIVTTKENITKQNRAVFDAYITFAEKDKTLASIDKAVSDLTKELNKIEVLKNPELLTSYQLKLRSFQKMRKEVEIENKSNAMVIGLLKQDLDHPSLHKLSAFSKFVSEGADVPVNIDGVHYNSEREYWETTLNNYVQNNFASEFAAEIKNKVYKSYNETGIITNSILADVKSSFDKLKTNSALANFQGVMVTAIQDASKDIIDLKVKEIENKYALDKEFVSSSDYQKAIGEMNSLKDYFGTDFSVTPQVTSIQNLLAEHKYKLTGSIQQKAAEIMTDPVAYGFPADATYEDVIKQIGPQAEVELPKETYLEKTPTEAAQVEITKAKVAPDVQKLTSEQRAKYNQLVSAGASESAALQAVKQMPEPEPEPEPEPKPKPKPKPEPEPTPEQKIHTVKGGETLWGIAQQELGSGARWRELKTPEGIGFTEETAKTLRVGQKLVIPS